MRSGTVVVIIGLFVLPTMNLVVAKAQDAPAESSRGFGKITPEYHSFYHLRKKEPFALIDNQGRVAAQILIYTPPGSVIKQRVDGTTQYDEKVPVKVVVSNLTPRCSVSVNWPAFLFREDGQPSSRGFGSPPDANPDTKVPPMGSYTHIFHFDSITTFHSGVAVVNEVHPELVLECSGHDTTAASQQNKATTAGTGKNASPSVASMGTAGADLSRLLSAPMFVPNMYNNDDPDVLSDFQQTGCVLNFVETSRRNGALHISFNFQNKIEGRASRSRPGGLLPGGTPADNFVTLQLYIDKFQPIFYHTEADLRPTLDALQAASSVCGGSLSVPIQNWDGSQ